jgi:hypothetical protein
VGKPKARSLPIALLLLGTLIPGAGRAGCDPPTITLRSELEDLEEIKSRLIFDFSSDLHGPRRFVYVENRGGPECGGSGCRSKDTVDSDRGGGVPVLRPQQWVVGFSGPLITAGPVSLRGTLAQLYNPLAHGPRSDAFTEPPELSLNLDLDVGGRRGVQLGLIPGYWSLLAVHREQSGTQLGSAIALPLRGNIQFNLVGLISSPPTRLEHERSWYAGGPLFPGGPITHLAGALILEQRGLNFSLVAAASAGQWTAPGMFATLDMILSVAFVDLALVLGYCSPLFFTPEGDTKDREWIAAARGEGNFGPLRLSAACSKELSPLSPFPETFRGCRDRFEAGIEITPKEASPRAWSIEGEAAWQRAWSAEGQEDFFRSLEAGSVLDWSDWSFAAGLRELRDGAAVPLRYARFSVGHDPDWGKIELEAEYRFDPLPGIELAAALDVSGEDRMLYVRIETEQAPPLPASGDSPRASDWLELVRLRMGWESSTELLFRRRPR